MQLCSDISLLIFGFNEVAHIEAEVPENGLEPKRKLS